MMPLKGIVHHILWVDPAAIILRVLKYKQALLIC